MQGSLAQSRLLFSPSLPSCGQELKRQFQISPKTGLSVDYCNKYGMLAAYAFDSSAIQASTWPFEPLKTRLSSLPTYLEHLCLKISEYYPDITNDALLQTLKVLHDKPEVERKILLLDKIVFSLRKLDFNQQDIETSATTRKNLLIFCSHLLAVHSIVYGRDAAQRVSFAEYLLESLGEAFPTAAIVMQGRQIGSAPPSKSPRQNDNSVGPRHFSFKSLIAEAA